LSKHLRGTTVATYAVLALAGAVSFLAPDRLTVSRSSACADGAASEAGAIERESAGAGLAPEPAPTTAPVTVERTVPSSTAPGAGR
jgi:hypothetical protein